MKSTFFAAAIALSTLSGAAFAADSSPPPAPADPLAAALAPIGAALNVVVQPIVVAPGNAITEVIAPSPPPAPAAAPAPAHHRHHHKHHHHA